MDTETHAGRRPCGRRQIGVTSICLEAPGIGRSYQKLEEVKKDGGSMALPTP